MTVIYHDLQGDITQLAGKRISIIGYGDRGRAFALNLHDSGLTVLVGGHSADSRAAAEEDGLDSTTIEEAVKQTQVILLMLPDEVLASVYMEQVAPYLKRGDILVFSSAYNVTFGFIEPPPFVDFGLIAPRIMGLAVRQYYEAGRGFRSFVAVGQDASGQAWSLVLGLAKAAGALKGGAIEVSFEREAELSLFAQQTIMPLFHHIIISAAKILIEKGYPPEAVFTELYLSGGVTYYLEQVTRSGLLETLRGTSLINQYGALSRLDRFNEMKLERLMEVTLEEIHSGDFAQEWAKEFADGNRRLKNLYRIQQSLDLWELEQQTLDLFGRESDSAS